jgi:Zn-dependent protease
LFSVTGIEVYLHWSWFIVAAFVITERSRAYSSLVWNALEYLALFVLVLLHEFGHAIACRQVGGRADHIILWPLGGVAFVAPPQRPGATLWSIAAGPLVNVILLPTLTLAMTLAQTAGWHQAHPDLYLLLRTTWLINLILLIFNLLPVYPLDGGQILRSLLWFWLGRGRSLLVAAIIGFAGGAALILFALVTRSVWFGIMAAFLLMNCWGGLQQALVIGRAEGAPRRPGFACPRCHKAPPMSELWTCPGCKERIDPFSHQAACPRCGTRFLLTHCPECGHASPLESWRTVNREP